MSAGCWSGGRVDPRARRRWRCGAGSCWPRPVEVTASLEEEDGHLMARVGGRAIGQLTPKMADRYRPLLQELRNAGWTDASCEARIIRSAKAERKIEAFLKLATPWTA